MAAYITTEERKKKLTHMCNYFNFESCIDLSQGVKVTPILRGKDMVEIPFNVIAQDIACFTAWWTMNILPTLNGFSGLDTIKWEFVK